MSSSNSQNQKRRDPVTNKPISSSLGPPKPKKQANKTIKDGRVRKEAGGSGASGLSSSATPALQSAAGKLVPKQPLALRPQAPKIEHPAAPQTLPKLPLRSLNPRHYFKQGDVVLILIHDAPLNDIFGQIYIPLEPGQRGLSIRMAQRRDRKFAVVFTRGDDLRENADTYKKLAHYRILGNLGKSGKEYNTKNFGDIVQPLREHFINQSYQKFLDGVYEMAIQIGRTMLNIPESNLITLRKEMDELAKKKQEEACEKVVVRNHELAEKQKNYGDYKPSMDEYVWPEGQPNPTSASTASASQ